ncbi:MAG: hypothetical protein C0501_14370 [Isosphaera sp.]|nr:hypothetical protein [Isosphaera sp.]
MSTVTLDLNKILGTEPIPEPAPDFVNVLAPRRPYRAEITAFGLAKTLQQWAELIGVTYSHLYSRFRHIKIASQPETPRLEAILRHLITYSTGGRSPAGDIYYVLTPGGVRMDRTREEWETHLGLPPGALIGPQWSPHGGGVYNPATGTYT